MARPRSSRRGCRVRWLGWIAVLWVAQAASAELGVPKAVGGSNFNWFALGPDCEREPYGIIANYHEPGVRALVREQLRGMRKRGQQRIAVGLYHARGDADDVGRLSGTILDSSLGVLHPRMRYNLREFLIDIREAEFRELLFRMHPQRDNDVIRRGSISDSLRDENWTVIVDAVNLLQRSGLNYRIDLMAEGMPRARIVAGVILENEPDNGSWSRYARTLWQRYVQLIGDPNTVGFSFVSDVDDERMDARVEHMEYVYTVDGQLRLPQTLAFSIYGTVQRDERWIIARYRQHLRDEGLTGLPWIIAETYYNDVDAALGIADALADNNGPRVYYVTQWPLQRESVCADVNVAPPLEFTALSELGF